MDPYLNIYFKINSKNISMKTNLIGDYNVENILTAISVGQYFKVSMEKIKIGIEHYIPDNWRSQIKKTGKNTLILDNYNANPVSMAAAIKNFEKIKAPQNQKVVIIGDMLELGKYSAIEHEKIIDLLNQIKFYKVFLVGNNFFKFLKQTNFSHFKNVESLGQYLKYHHLCDYYILLKSSRSVHLEKVIQFL